ncbi:hypothetical protein [Rhodanobacter koreensis]
MEIRQLGCQYADRLVAAGIGSFEVGEQAGCSGSGADGAIPENGAPKGDSGGFVLHGARCHACPARHEAGAFTVGAAATLADQRSGWEAGIRHDCNGIGCRAHAATGCHENHAGLASAEPITFGFAAGASPR